MFTEKMKWSVVVAVSVFASGLMGADSFAAEKEIVSFRLTQWKEAHFDDAKTAEVNFKTLKQLGCEAERHQHGGHFDVRFRCEKWRSISLSSHELAHQWERWLKVQGFETSHRH